MSVIKREYKSKFKEQIWGYSFYHNAKRYRQAGYTSKAEAEIAEANAKKNEYEGKRLIKSSATFSSLIEPFLEHRKTRQAESTAERDRRRMRILQKYFGNMKVALITNADIDKYIDQRKRSKTVQSGQTLNLEINLLSVFLGFALSRGCAHHNAAKGIKRLKVTQTDKAIPTDEEFANLVEAAKKTETGTQLACWIMTRGYTGSRPNESFFLEWKDIDFDKDQITFRPKKGCPLKNGKFKVVPLHEDLRESLIEWKKEWQELTGKCDKKHDWIFVNPRHPELRAKGFRKTFEKAKTIAGINENGFNYYTLRHYFITRCVENGINFLVIAKWVGHSSTRMIEQVYSHLSPKFHSKEMAKLQINGNGKRKKN